MHLGDVVFNFTADSTHGIINFYQWQGDKWVVLFSHPADFTPICTSELGHLALHEPYFTKRNVKLLGHSVGDVQSHLEWIKDIQHYCSDIPGEFPYPIMSDPQRELAVRLGMLDETNRNNLEYAETVRALYIIDPNHTVRMAVHYPNSTGRNVSEIIRVIDSIQLVEKVPQVETPVDWRPGDKVMVLPTITQEDLDQFFPEGVETVPMPSGRDYFNTAHFSGL